MTMQRAARSPRAAAPSRYGSGAGFVRAESSAVTTARNTEKSTR